jgi:hypothetical protein
MWFFMFRVFAIVVTTLNGFFVTFKFIIWKSLSLSYFKPQKNLYLDPQTPISKPHFNPPKNIFQTLKKPYFRSQKTLFQIAKNLHEDGKDTPLLQNLQQTTTTISTKFKPNVF